MLKKEIGLFIIFGSLTVLVDFLSYRGLVVMDIMSVEVAKAIGFMTGTLFAYFANRFWTFGHKQHASGSSYRFAGLYSVTLGANVVINSFCLFLLASMTGAVELSFLVATGVSASLNFLGMKFFVFNSRTVESV